VSLQGSGATFPAPIYKRWFLDYYQKNPGVRVNYSPIGSGAGIRQFTSGLVLFGASDAGMSKKEIAALPKSYGGVARSLATEPDVLLMDEPCSAIDPIATRKIEELMRELKKNYTIAIVTHNLQQAKRVADKTAFLYLDADADDHSGYLVEYGDTQEVFEHPKEKHTQEYIQGEFS